MTTVFVVTTGSYSDYDIHSIHSTQERAEAVVAWLERGRYVSDVGWYGTELDAYEIPTLPEGMTPYVVSVSDTYRRVVESCDDITIEFAQTAQQGQDYRGVFTTWCFARDEAHALKVAQDRRAQFLAEKNGLS